MARTYLVFGDIEGKLDVLRVSAPSATARAATASREARAQGQYVGLVVRPERRLPEA
jgi:hypothetical protein